MTKHGILAERSGYGQLELRVLHSSAGYYIGTLSEDGCPISRESINYYPSFDEAKKDLDNNTWIQKWAF